MADRNFVLEYSPRQETGVSENLPDTPPFVGHDHAFPSVDEAVDFFKQMLAKAAREEFSTAASRE